MEQTKAPALVPMASVAGAGVGMAAILWLAAHRLTAQEQGFFFSFLSIGTLVQLSDFGLSYSVLQTAGRLAGIGRTGDMRNLARFVARWNLLVSCISATTAGAIGWLTFSIQADAASVSWTAPWVAYAVGCLLAQLGMPGLALREGFGRVSQVWRVRLVQEWTSAIVCLAALSLGARLWSLAAYSLTRAIVSAAWLTMGDPIKSARGDPPAYTVQRWMREVWPFQWKMGLSALSGFLIFRAFAPLILIEKGPILAGQFGLVIAMTNVLLATSSAWPLSHTSRYAKLSAERRFIELDQEFPVLLRNSTALVVLGSVGLSLSLWAARVAGLPLAQRLTDPATTAIVLFTAVPHHAVMCAAVFMRAEGREPLVIPSVVGGCVTGVAVWVAARYGSARDIAIANLLLAIAGIPVAYLLLRIRQLERRQTGGRE